MYLTIELYTLNIIIKLLFDFDNKEKQEWSSLLILINFFKRNLILKLNALSKRNETQFYKLNYLYVLNYFYANSHSECFY